MRVNDGTYVIGFASKALKDESFADVKGDKALAKQREKIWLRYMFVQIRCVGAFR